MVEILVELCDRNKKFIINNLYPLYLHELSAVRTVYTNKYGVFEDNDDYKTLEEQIPVFDIWWEKENVLFPFLIIVDNLPAGFALVATPPYIFDGSDFFLHEFFILGAYRGTGIAEKAAIKLFDKFKGNWVFFTTPNDKNIRALKHWRKTLAHYTNNQYVEEVKDTIDHGVNAVFNFTNK